jgi:hypothetical protein
MKINIVFSDYILPISCYKLLNESFFIKQTHDNCNINEIMLFSKETVSSEIKNVLKYLLSENVECNLKREVLYETETTWESSYKFINSEFLNSLSEDSIIELSLLFDCVDIKPILMALLSHVTDQSKNLEEFLIKVRAKRYNPPQMFIK